MEDDGYIPPMTPDDFAALAGLAGPLYQQTKVIEAYTSSNPVPNAMDDYWSNNIRRELEQAKHLAQASVSRPTPRYVPPAPQEIVSDVPYVVPSPQPQPQIVPNIPPPPQYSPKQDDGQLEFRFDGSEQKTTNDLLREISRKLTKLINIIEKLPTNQNVPKLTDYFFPEDQV